MTTKIPWVVNPDGTPGEVLNPVVGCTPVSEGCKNCFAERLHNMRHRAYPHRGNTPACYMHPFDQVTLLPERLEKPLHWKKPRTILYGSMCDMFHEDIPYHYLDAVMANIALTPQHRHMFLTKRPAEALAYLDQRTDSEWAERLAMTALENYGRSQEAYRIAWCAIRERHADPAVNVGWPMNNLAIGVSVENQRTADERIEVLMQIPAAARFVSYEPALEYVNFENWIPLPGIGGILERQIDWLIMGEESGPGRRTVGIHAFYEPRDDCASAGVPLFVKQMDIGGKLVTNPALFPDDLQVRQFPEFLGVK